MIHFMMKDHSEVVAYSKDPMFIQDGSTLFHTMTNLVSTFRGITLQLLYLMLAKCDFLSSQIQKAPLDLDALMGYSLSSVRLCLVTADGLFAHDPMTFNTCNTLRHFILLKLI